jgi:serine O-acetyltransferase
VSGILFRVGHAIWAYQGPLTPLVWLLKPFYILLKRANEVVNGISIEPQARIGEGLYVVHGGSVRIAGRSVIGNNCNISHEVTLGVAIREKKRAAPVLGNRVFIGPGAKLFGDIVIGDDVAIGANAVVNKSLPDRAVAVGVPARIISRQGSFEFVLYRGMDTDESRKRSLHLRDAAEPSRGPG